MIVRLTKFVVGVSLEEGVIFVGNVPMLIYSFPGVVLRNTRRSTMTATLNITILGVPISVNAAYRTVKRGGKVYMTDGGKEWKKLIFWEVFAGAQNWQGAGREYILTVDYFFPDNRRRDSHNYAKLIVDAVAAALGIDDRYIRYRDGTVEVDKENPRVVLHLEVE
jgi:crossover junction endodeoxyribonuclease RusA